MEQKKWWEDFLTIENAEPRKRNLPTVQKQKEVVWTPEPVGIFFDEDAVADLDLSEQEWEIYARMNGIPFYDLQKFFTLGVYYDMMKQQGFCRTKLFATTVKLEVLKTKDGDRKNIEALERKHTQLNREMDFLTNEIDELEVIMLDLGFLDDIHE